MKYILALLIYIANSIALSAQINTPNEQIDLFHANLKVFQDGSMKIVETISYITRLHKVKHGIIRKIPTIYTKDHDSYEIGFIIDYVLKDGANSRYNLVDAPNGKVILIGSKRILIPAGKHIYTIAYRTNKHISFFSDHDELYWNVTGNDWPFAINKAQADIILPDSVNSKEITAQAYTGYQGSKEKFYRANINGNKITIETTRKLNPHEGFTIVVTWPKGIINQKQAENAQPLKEQTFSSIFNRIAPIWLILALISTIGIYIRAWYSQRNKNSVVIPSFYPPKGISAGVVSYLISMGFTPKTLAVQIVDLAIHGFITINLKKKLFKKYYTLEYQKNHPKDKTLEQDILLKNLFSQSQSIDLISKNQDRIARTQNEIQNSYDTSLGPNLFDFGLDYRTSAAIVSIISFVVPFITGYTSMLFIIWAVAIGLINIIGFKITRSYSQEGNDLFNKIEGFKWFLMATEQERFKVIGTPPDRTPELYEKYLPYAMALGVEEKWTKQFVPVFEKLQQANVPYNPTWYHGTGMFTRDFSIIYFTSGLQSSINNLVSSAQYTPIISANQFPGGSSGTGGGGSSGGGFGGGGGGSW